MNNREKKIALINELVDAARKKRSLKTTRYAPLSEPSGMAFGEHHVFATSLVATHRGEGPWKDLLTVEVSFLDETIQSIREKWLKAG